MNSSIKYKGKVSIEVKNKPRRVLNNSGTPELFNLLCRILAQNLTPYSQSKFSAELPIYIDILSIPSSVEVTSNTLLETPNYGNYAEYSILTSSAIIYSRTVNNEELTLTTVINNSSIKSSFPGTDIDYIVLVDGNKKNVLAFVELDADFKSSIQVVATDPNSQATISWAMKFTN